LIIIQPVIGFGQIPTDSVQTRELEELVIKGIRAGEHDPVTQTTINVKKIESIYAGQDASVILERLTPSIITFSDAGSTIGNYNQFRLRGIDQSRINVTLNGVPLNDMIDQGVFFSNFSDFANSVESIQVQRGVGTSSNGVASYGGSVNFESTRLNKDEPSAELQLLAGSFKTLRISGEVNTGRLKNDLAFYSRFTRTKSDGYKNHSGSDSYSYFFSGGHFGKKDVIKITAFAGKTQNDQSYLPVLLSNIRENPKTNYNHPNDTDDFEQELIQFQYSRILNPAWTSNSMFYYGGARGVFPFGIDNATQLLFGLKNNHYGFFSDVNYDNHTIDFTTGVHGYLFRRENYNSLAPNVAQPDYEDKTDKEEISVFTKLSYNIGSFHVYGDLQMRYVNLGFKGQSLLDLSGQNSSSRQWIFVNPKIGVNYSIGQKSSAYASFGRSGREPTRTDILQGDGSGIYDYNYFSVIDSDVVKEEYVNDLELGYRYSSKKLNLNVNYFHMTFENEISLVGALAATSYIPLRQNVDNSRRSGLETVINWQLDEKFDIILIASYLSTKVDQFINANSEAIDNAEHIFSPKWIIGPSLVFNPSSRWSINLSGRYVDQSYMELSNDSVFKLPDFFVLDSRVDFNVSETVTFSFMVNNILDELYFTDGSPVDFDFDGVVEGPGYRVQPPRNFYGMLRVRF